MEIRKIGNLYQLRCERIGTVYQSHDIEDVKRFARENNCLYTVELKGNWVGDVKYGRTINW